MDNNEAGEPKEPQQHFWDILFLVVLFIIVFVCCYALIS